MTNNGTTTIPVTDLRIDDVIDYDGANITVFRLPTWSTDLGWFELGARTETEGNIYPKFDNGDTVTLVASPSRDAEHAQQVATARDVLLSVVDYLAALNLTDNEIRDAFGKALTVSDNSLDLASALDSIEADVKRLRTLGGVAL